MLRATVLPILLAACVTACGTTSPTTQPRPDDEPSGSLDEASLDAWLRWRFPREVAAGQLAMDYGSADGVADVFDEMAGYGLATLGELAAIVPPDFQRRGAVVFRGEGTNVAGLMRDVMIIHDADRYATRAYKATWCGCEEDFPAAQAYGVSLNPLGEAGVFACCDGDGVEGGDADAE
jgi:hypothetical protein